MASRGNMSSTRLELVMYRCLCWNQVSQEFASVCMYVCGMVEALIDCSHLLDSAPVDRVTYLLVNVSSAGLEWCIVQHVAT